MAKEKNTEDPVVTKSNARKRFNKKYNLVVVSVLGVIILAAIVVAGLIWFKGNPNDENQQEQVVPNQVTQLREEFDKKLGEDPADAKGLYDAAIKNARNESEKTELRIARTTALSENGKADEAIASALEAIELNRTHETLIAASWAYNLKQDRAKALEYAKAAHEALQADVSMNELDREYALKNYSDMISELNS